MINLPVAVKLTVPQHTVATERLGACDVASICQDEPWSTEPMISMEYEQWVSAENDLLTKLETCGLRFMLLTLPEVHLLEHALDPAPASVTTKVLQSCLRKRRTILINVYGE